MEIEKPFSYRPFIEKKETWFGKGEYLAGYEILHRGDVVYTVRQNENWTIKYVDMLNFGYKLGFGDGYVKARERYNKEQK